MRETLKIKAKNKEEAISLAKSQFEDILEKEIDKSNLSLHLLKEKRGFLGLGRKKRTYEVIYDNSVSKEEEEFLDVAMESIAIDGDFNIKINEEGIFLKVKDAQGDGHKVTNGEVKNELDRKEIIEVDWQKVREILEQAEEKWELIAPRKTELDRDPEISIDISDDKLKAYLSYIPALGNKKLSREDIDNILEKNGIKVGIKEDVIKRILKERKAEQSILIAEGQPAIPGKDSEFIYHFEQDKKSIGTKRENGSIDFYNLGLITNVNPGDVLVTKKDPEPGKAGISVTGKELKPPKPKNRKLPKGKNTEIEDEHTLVAKSAGQVVVDQRDKVQVLPVHEVKGDVDLSTGNIDFVGNVIIYGSVSEGFKIRADGNVEVKGSVSVSDINAGGDIVIHRGYIGKNKSKIEAKGNVKAMFVENGYIRAGKSIYIGDAVMHSRLIAGDSIEVTSKKGLLVGGVSKARSKIEANIFGSTLATSTVLEAGVDPELKNKIKELEEEIKSSQNNLIKTLKALKILNKFREQNGSLPEEKVIMSYQLEKTRDEIERSIKEKEEEIVQLQSELSLCQSGYILAKSKVYAGVKIAIANAQMITHNEMNGARFKEDDGEIVHY